MLPCAQNMVGYVEGKVINIEIIWRETKITGSSYRGLELPRVKLQQIILRKSWESMATARKREEQPIEENRP